LSAIEEIKQKTDIVEIIGQYVQLSKSGRTYRAPCPFHSEKKPSFFVYPEQQTWHCFGACNTGGDVFSFIMKKEGLDFGEALRLLAEKTGVTLPSPAKNEAEDKAREKLLRINQAAAQYFNNLLLKAAEADEARQYLQKRGLNEKSCADFQLGYSLSSWESAKQYLIGLGYQENDLLEAGMVIQAEGTGRSHDRFRHHIMFPIMDERGRVTGFGARVLDNSLPKYINSPQTRIFDKSGSLYGFHLAKSAIRQAGLAVLVEGYMDVIVAHQYGFSNVIAPMGVAITDKQINQIKKLTRNVALALDPDAAGEEAAMRCVGYENSLDAEVKVITLPQGKDPDEVIREDPGLWRTAVEKAIPVIEYTISTVTARLDIKTTPGKTEAVNKLLPIIAGVKAGTRQYDYLTKLSLAIGIDEKRLEAALGRFRNDRKASETRAQALQKATRSISSNPLEEYALAILLQHPEMKAGSGDLLIDYFENSENRAIFDKWQTINDAAGLRDLLDPIIQEHLDSLLSRNLPGSSMEERLMDCIIRLRERYLRNLEMKKAEILALEAETGVKNADLSKLVELGSSNSLELYKLEKTKSKSRGEVKDEKR
jgi:DNA primase